jgi:hypothetical protein
MRLQKNISARRQIDEAVKQNIPLVFDLREERMGDKAAAVNVASWIAREHNAQVTLVEAKVGKTPFMLSDYSLSYQSGDKILSTLVCTTEEPRIPLQGLDVHTATNNDSLWMLNPYLHSIGFRGLASVNDESLKNSDEIIFAVLTGSEYNQRRDMKLGCARITIDLLRAEGFTVTVLSDKQHVLLPDAEHLSFDECIKRIARCRVFIGGDTGFTHVSALFGRPTIALYPDWYEAGIAKQPEAERTAEWWNIPTTPKSFLPNARTRSVVTFSSANTWSPDHVIASAKRFYSSVEV